MMQKQVRNSTILFLMVIFLYPAFARIDKSSILSEINFKGNFVLNEDELKILLKIPTGQPFNYSGIPFAIEKLEGSLFNRGYLFARIDSAQTIYDTDSSHVSLVIYGHSGEQVHFGRIHIQTDSLPEEDYSRLLTIREGDVYSNKAVKREINKLLNFAADNGFLYAKVKTAGLDIYKKEKQAFADLRLHVQENKKIYIKNYLLKGNSYTADYVILRELGINPGSRYSKKIIEIIPQRLLRLEIFKDVKKPQILAAGDDSIYVQIEVEEGNATVFDGVVGYIPEQTGSQTNQDGYFTGQLDLTFKNLFGSARKFEVHWKKPDRLSEEFFISYTESWLFNFPLNLNFGLERIVQDTTFIKWDYALNLNLRLFRDFYITGSIGRKTATPDSAASRDLRLLKNEVTNIEVGIEYDTRDYRINPRSGLYLVNTYAYGLKRNLGPEYLLVEDNVKRVDQLQTLKAHFEWYYNLWTNQVFGLRLIGMQVSGAQLQLTDYFWFGGFQSLRGYRERQFRGDIVAWANLEYRFVLGRNSRVFLFNDWGFYNDPDVNSGKNEILPGYGAGVRFETPLGILGVDYGLGRDDNFSQGKIHFGIINRF